MIVGSILLAIDPHKFFSFRFSLHHYRNWFFFKPNISTMVGELYKDGDHRTDAGFSLFYAGINLGAFLGGYVCVAMGKGYMLSSIIEEPHRWNVAFGLAAIGMLASLINFNFTKRRLGPIGLQPGHPDAINKTKPLCLNGQRYAVYGEHYYSFLLFRSWFPKLSIPIILCIQSGR